MTEATNDNFMTEEAENPVADETVRAEEEAPATAREEPPALTREEEKKLAYKYFVFAAIALGGIFIPQIFHVFDSLFDRIYYGNLTRVFFYACNAIFWIPFIIIFDRQLRKHTGYRALHRGKKELSLKRILIIYACAIVPILIVSAVLGFNLKIVYELGKRVTGMQLLSNAMMYVHGGVKLIIAVMFLELVQEACNLLYKGAWHNIIPWGGIALALIVGFGDVLVAYLSGTYSLFVWLYIAFDLLYGVIYLLSEKTFTVTYFVSLIIYIL